MKSSPSNLKIVAKLLLWNILLVSLVMLTSCKECEKNSAAESIGFVLRIPSSDIRNNEKREVETVDSVMSTKWEKGCSRWHGYSTLAGGQ